MSESNNNNPNNEKNDNIFSIFINDSSEIKNDNQNENKFNPKTIIKPSQQKRKNHQLYKSLNLNNLENNCDVPSNNNKENEEEIIKKELEEKEKNLIRDKLKCFICYGKAINATMCIKCKGIACEECVKKMLSINKICSRCKQKVRAEDMIKLPFMNDLTSFFINNVEKRQSPGKQIGASNKINLNKNDMMIKSEFCKYHPEKVVEYVCVNCCENLCAECLLFFNKKNVAKHAEHIILSNEEINQFNLDKIIKEYKTLLNFKLNINNNKNKFNLDLKDLESRKIIEGYIQDLIKSQTICNYNKKKKKKKNVLNSLKNKKNEIEKGIQSFNNHFNRLKDGNNMEQFKKYQKDLKNLNIYPYDKNDIEKRIIFLKDICCERYESEFIELEIPNNGHYVEELNVLNKELNFIPNTNCKLQSQLLDSSIVFTLVLDVNDEFYQIHKPTFLGDLFIFGKKMCECLRFGDYYNKGVQVLSLQFEFSKFKSLLDENNKTQLKFHVCKIYYK